MNISSKKNQDNDHYDIDLIINEIYKIIEFMSSDTLIEMREKFFPQYKCVIEKQFEEFANNYYSVLQLLINGSDIKNLCMMLKELHSAKKKQTPMEYIEKHVTNELSNQYVIPVLEKLNKKEKKIFIKKKKKKKKEKEN